MADRPTDRPTDGRVAMRGHRKVTTSSNNNGSNANNYDYTSYNYTYDTISAASLNSLFEWLSLKMEKLHYQIR